MLPAAHRFGGLAAQPDDQSRPDDAQQQHRQRKGKQPVKKLVRSGAKLENVAVNDNNIKSFERIARKYGIDYSLRKDSSENPPKYYIFFKANDSKVMNAAFSEYTRRSAELEDKPSVREKLKTIGEHVKVKTQERTREKSKTREAEL